MLYKAGRKKDNQAIFRLFFQYVALNIAGQLAYSCYTLADTFFVSASLGADGLAALNLAFPVFCFINGSGLMLGIGGGTVYSIQKSRGEQAETDKTFTAAFSLMIFLAAAFVLSGIALSGRIVKLLGADASIFPMTNTYLRVMLLFAPAFLTNNLLQCFVRNDGNPSLSMSAMITGCFSNIVLDYIFIFPLEMGIFGAILATGLAPVISLAVLSPYFIRRKHTFHFAKCVPGIRRLAGIVSTGVPALITEASSGIVMILFNFILLRLAGNTGVAAYGVIAAISLVVVAIYTGLSQGIQPLLILHYGLKKTAEVKTLLRYALLAALLLSALIYSVIFFGASPIASVFNSEGNQTLQGIAENGLRLYFTACPFIGFNIVLSTYFASTECPRPAQFISLLRGFFLLLPVAFLLSSLFQMTGVWAAFPVTELITAALGFLILRTRHLCSRN